MQFTLNFKSGKAVYLQLVKQVRAAAASGALHDGDPLPSIRTLSEDLRVNRNTVAKAYAELENQGVIETIAGKGCFLRANGTSPLRKDARRRLLAERLDEAVVAAHHLQIGREDFLELAQQRYDAVAGRRSRATTSEPS